MRIICNHGRIYMSRRCAALCIVARDAHRRGCTRRPRKQIAVPRASGSRVECRQECMSSPPYRAHYRVTNSSLQRVGRGDFVAPFFLLLLPPFPLYFFFFNVLARGFLCVCRATTAAQCGIVPPAERERDVYRTAKQLSLVIKYFLRFSCDINLS